MKNTTDENGGMKTWTIIETPCFPAKWKIVRKEGGRIRDTDNSTWLYHRTREDAKATIARLKGEYVG